MAPQKKQRAPLAQDKNRLNILKAAFELFAQKGYAQTSVDSVSVKAKVSKGLIYHYFDSKEELLKGVFLLMKEEADQLFSGMDKLPPEKLLTNMVSSSFEYITRRSKNFRLLLALTVQRDVLQGLKKEIEEMRNEWLRQLTQVFSSLGYEQPEAEAYLFCALLDGIGIGYTTVPAGYPMKEISELIMKRYGNKLSL